MPMGRSLWPSAWVGWPGSGALLESQSPPLPQHAFLPASYQPGSPSPNLFPLPPHHQALPASQGSKFDAFCANTEGWGPLSPLRPLDLSPCFELGALNLVPSLIMILFGAYLPLCAHLDSAADSLNSHSHGSLPRATS